MAKKTLKELQELKKYHKKKVLSLEKKIQKIEKNKSRIGFIHYD